MKRCACCYLVFLALVFFVGRDAIAAEFAADFKQFNSWESEKSGKIYVRGDKSRMEFFESGQAAQIMITNPQKKAAWMVNTSEKTYMEINYDESAWQKAQEGEGQHPDFKKESLGKETVSGYVCDKERYTYNDKSMGSAIYWFSKKLSYPVKWEAKNEAGTSSFLLTKIQEGKLSDSLFEIPQGYKPLSMGQMGQWPQEQREEGKSGQVVEEDAKDIGRDAHDAAKESISEGIKDSIREGLRGIFGGKN